MTKLSRLRLEAIESTDFRGHNMSRFEHSGAAGRRQAVAKCETCGKFAFIEERPAANGIEIGGQAVALGCED